MFGILVVADQFSFIRATITKEYLDCLVAKATPPPLEFRWWPEESRSKYPNAPHLKTLYGTPYGDLAHREFIVKALCLMQQNFVKEQE
jgi:hypothetical protein